VICTTHFLEMFSLNLLADGKDGVNALQMEVQVPERSGDAAAPLFRLKEGIASSSAGLVCAKMSGVKKSVILRAKEIVSAMKNGGKVQPLNEVLDSELGLPDRTKALISVFLKTNWNEATDDDILQFREAIALHL